MQIKFAPVRMDTPLTLERVGDVLIFNGEKVDLSTYDPLAPCDWIVGAPLKSKKDWQVEIILPCGPDAPEETRFPQPLEVKADGPVNLPPFTSGEPSYE